MPSELIQPFEQRKGSKKIVDGRRAGEGENPYLNAKRTWNEHMGSIIAERRMWMIIAVLSLMIVFASVSGMIYFGTKSTYIPYVVEVDKHGKTQATGIAEPTNQTDPRIVHSELAKFIQNARFVSSDPRLQRQAIMDLYTHLSKGDPATNKMSEWLRSNSPFEKAKSELIDIEIKSILPIANESWQVDWTETRRSLNGMVNGNPSEYRASISWYIGKSPSSISDKQMRSNPMNIYVRDFTWSQLL